MSAWKVSHPFELGDEIGDRILSRTKLSVSESENTGDLEIMHGVLVNWTCHIQDRETNLPAGGVIGGVGSE